MYRQILEWLTKKTQMTMTTPRDTLVLCFIVCDNLWMLASKKLTFIGGLKTLIRILMGLKVMLLSEGDGRDYRQSVYRSQLSHVYPIIPSSNSTNELVHCLPPASTLTTRCAKVQKIILANLKNNLHISGNILICSKERRHLQISLYFKLQFEIVIDMNIYRDIYTRCK